MIQNFLYMNGYGIYVWLSFGITLILCTLLYYKTYKTLKKYEKNFAKEIEQLSKSERKQALEKSKIASQVFSSYKKSI